MQQQRFNSLQTGKHRETNHVLSVGTMFCPFQFPSNGKARGNSRLRVMMKQNSLLSSFDSLQTGKHAETGECFPVAQSTPFKRESMGKGFQAIYKTLTL